MRELEGKRILVTGGTGHLGEAICRRAAELGARVAFTWTKNGSKASGIAASLAGSLALEADVRDASAVDRAVNAAVAEFGGIDGVVNNAGMSQVLPLPLLEEEDIDLAVDVNLKGPLRVTRAAVRHMIRTGGGSVVLMGSIAGHKLLDVPVTYAMTKAGLSGMAKALASELKRFSIRVNNVVPGMVDGGIARGIPEDHRKAFLAHCAVGRPGTALEIAEVVCFLLSDRSSYVNAQDIAVDGGF